LFLIDEADSVTVLEEPIAYITPYLVSEYENVNVSDYANLVEEYGDKEASVNDLVAIEDYANVAMAIYPFLQGFLTIKSTRSILDISQTMSELDVSDTNTIVSITR
jgi:hypothetical protein